MGIRDENIIVMFRNANRLKKRLAVAIHNSLSKIQNIAIMT